MNSADCEIVFVEFLGDLVKLHLTAGGERMLAKVPGDRYPGSARPGGGDDPDLVEGGGCPAPHPPDPAPHLDLADIEEDEREVEHETERALGEQRGALRERGRKLGHARVGGCPASSGSPSTSSPRSS